MRGLRAWFEKRDAELDREVEAHLELETEDRREDGTPGDEARHAARRAFGNLATTKENVRAAWGWTRLEQLARDLRFAFRVLGRNRGFTAAVIVTLGIGIGANSAMFSLVNAILVRPLPLADADKLIQIVGPSLRQQVTLVTLRARGKAAEYAAYTNARRLNLTGEAEPERLTGGIVSANLFSLLRAEPLLGRVFEAGEDTPGRDAVVVLSYSYWQTRFQGDPRILGRVITLDDRMRRIVGVMPPGFAFPSRQIALWIPTCIDSTDEGPYWWGTAGLRIVGRLRPGFHVSHVQTEIEGFVPEIRAAFPRQMWPHWGTDARAVSLQEALFGNVRERLLVLLAAVGLVLLIACANVGNLLLARGASRKKEIVLRASLGASRGRIARQLLTESLVLSLGGGIVGLALAVMTSGALTFVLPPELPRLSDVGVDVRVLAFTGLLAIGTGLVFGVLPALRLSKPRMQSSLKGEERTVAGEPGRQRLSAAIIVAEVAVGVVVVVSAGLVARSLWRLANVDPGFESANVLTAAVTPNESLCEERARCIAFYDELLSEIRALPGVQAAAAVTPLPLSGSTRGAALELEGHPLPAGSLAPSLWTTIATPGYLESLHIPILRGRSFSPADHEASADVVLVSRATAERWWPGENPIGKRLRYVSQENRWRTVIGVAADTRQATLAGDPDWVEGAIYLPYPQFPDARMTVILRTAGEPMEMAGAVGRIVSGLRPDVPVTEIQTMDEVLSASLATPRSTMRLLSAFAALALLLSATGVYAVASHGVAQRTREFGVRIALGAQRREILAGVIARSLALGGVGLALGITAAWGATRALKSFLYEVPTTDLVTFAGVPSLLLVVTAMASYLPARRASNVNPTVALRGE